MFNGEQLRRVMDCAVAIVVVANRAVEHVVAQNPIKCLYQRSRRLRRLGGDLHPIGDCGCAGPGQAAVHFHHGRVARLNSTELRVIADVGDRHATTVDQIDENLVGLSISNDTIDGNINHGFVL